MEWRIITQFCLKSPQNSERYKGLPSAEELINKNPIQTTSHTISLLSTREHPPSEGSIAKIISSVVLNTDPLYLLPLYRRSMVMLKKTDAG